MKKYKHIFFDLDHTLWDFDKNSREVLGSLYDHYELNSLGGFTMEEFFKQFVKTNRQLWQMHNRSEIDKASLRSIRFNIIFEQLGVEGNGVPSKITEDYHRLCPTKCNVFPHTFSVLDYLKKKYVLHIITNGFEDVQFTKLKSAGLIDYFIEVITPEEAGAQKPHKKIFEYALQKTKARCRDCIMIGDNLITDILGAKDTTMDQVYFNPEKNLHNEKVTYEISCLSQLMQIL